MVTYPLHLLLPLTLLSRRFVCLLRLRLHLLSQFHRIFKQSSLLQCIGLFGLLPTIFQNWDCIAGRSVRRVQHGWRASVCINVPSRYQNCNVLQVLHHLTLLHELFGMLRYAGRLLSLVPALFPALISYAPRGRRLMCRQLCRRVPVHERFACLWRATWRCGRIYACITGPLIVLRFLCPPREI